jgi:tetratricopeptide (TPR) repeat protein
MIAISEVLDWLNYDDVSNLSSQNLFSLQQLNSRLVPQVQKNAALQDLRINAETILNNLEKAEIKVNLGVYFFGTMNYEAAIVYLNDSLNLYSPDSHRQAVVYWLRGIVSWKIIENIQAHANWRRAINIFVAQRALSLSVNNTNKINWYDEQIEKMRVEVTMTAEEAFKEWLNRIVGITSLDRNAQLYVNEIEARIVRKEYKSAYEIGRALRRINNQRLNTDEVAEANIIIGMKYHRMGQASAAIEFFRNAEIGFNNDNYRKAVTLWIKGVSQWELKYENENAVKNWREAIDLFKIVREEMNKINNLRMMNWLDGQIPILQQALDEKNRFFFNSFPA